METALQLKWKDTEVREGEWAHSRYDQLNFTEEKRLTVLCLDQCYQERIARAYDKKVKPRSFKGAIWSWERFYHSKGLLRKIQS